MTVYTHSAAREILAERRKAAHDVAADLFALEMAIDNALAAAARLSGTIPEARIRARMAATVGQDAIRSVGALVAALHAAREGAVDAHNRFADLHEKMFRHAYASGDLWKLLEDSDTGNVVRMTAQETAQAA